jgi:hypothetical protein
MKKVNQFWQDVDLAICTLIFRQRLHQIIVEGRNIRQPFPEINKGLSAIPGRDRVLYRYHAVTMARLQKHS